MVKISVYISQHYHYITSDNCAHLTRCTIFAILFVIYVTLHKSMGDVELK